MPFRVNVPTPAGTFQIEGATQADVFVAIANIDEVFSEKSCGLCDGTQLRYVVREHDGNQYFELSCCGCGASLHFGQRREPKGSLFVIRKLDANGKPSWKDGEYGKHRGWTKYRGEKTVQREGYSATRPSRENDPQTPW